MHRDGHQRHQIGASGDAAADAFLKDLEIMVRTLVAGAVGPSPSRVP